MAFSTDLGWLALVFAVGCSSASNKQADEAMSSGVGVTVGGSTAGTTAGAGGSYSTGYSSSSAAGTGGGGYQEVDSGANQSWQKTTGDTLFPAISVGGKDKLDLVRMRVTTVIEGLRARTVVDHVFYNPFDKVLEGTLTSPLPPEATVSFFGMFDATSSKDPDFFGPSDALKGATPEAVANAQPDALVQGADKSLWAGGKIARVVKSAQATNAYEQETAKQIDPGLVEEVAPNTFRTRVYPLPPHAWVRVVLAYEQTLPRVAGELEYALPLPKGAIDDVSFTFTGSKGALASLSYQGTVPSVAPVPGAQDWTYGASFTGSSPGGTFVFKAKAAGSTAEADALAGSDADLGKDYFYLRIQPDLSALKGSAGSARGIFLLDTSFSEHPSQFWVNFEILKGILEGSPELKQFRVMTFDTSARWLGGWTANDAAGRASATAAVQKILLEGATNVGAALDLLAKAGVPAGETVDLFLLSDGVLTWGDSNVPAIAQRFATQTPFSSRFFAYRTGLAENLALLGALSHTGAIFNCLTPADVAACAVAHRSAGIVVDSVELVPSGNGAEAANLLVAGRQATLFPGATMTLAGQLVKPGAATVTVKGKSLGAPIEVDVPVTLQPKGILAPRAWAEIAVTQLAETGDASLEGLAMAIAQRYRVASRLGSFLILQSENDYVKFNLADETAKFQGQSIAKLVSAGLAKLGQGLSSWQRLYAVIDDWKNVNHIADLDGGKLASKIANLAGDGGMDLPPSQLVIPAVAQSDVPDAYLKTMSHEPTAFDPFVAEAERRRGLGDVDGAFRALSTLMENNPSMATVQRLAGYRVDSWGQPIDASWLFFNVLEKRPFEPQSYRDLANALGLQRPGLSALLYEGVLAGTWNPKFKGFKKVVGEEYALLVNDLGAQSPGALAGYLQERKSALGLPSPNGDLRVTITWNTDDVDIDLWVTDPNGDKCYYANKVIPSGGELTDDLTQGYGPERFLAAKAIPGPYKVQVHYFANNGKLLNAQTYVTVTVMTHVGTAKESIERFNVVLNKKDDVATIATVEF